MTREMYKAYVVLEPGGKVVVSTDRYDRVKKMVAYAIIGSDEKAAQIMTDCEKAGKRLIFSYEDSDEDESQWEYIGSIPDGCLYVG